MPIHIEAKEKDIAKVVLLVGNPERSQYIANNFFQEAKQFTQYRFMYGYTGTYKGVPVSVQTSGMGTASISIIAEELNMLKAHTLIRLGTCGALDYRLKHSDIIIATAAHSSHDIYKQVFPGANFSAVPDFVLCKSLYEKAQNKGIPVHTGSVVSSENFYEEDYSLYIQFAHYQTLAVEMEAYALFGIAAKYGLKSACVLTVSDILFEKKANKIEFNPRRASKEDIRKGVDKITELTLDTIVENYSYLSNTS